MIAIGKKLREKQKCKKKYGNNNKKARSNKKQTLWQEKR